MAAHGRIDTDSTSVKSLLKIADKRSTQGETVAYPSAKDKNGNDKIFNWFSLNRKHAKSLVTLPHPLDDNITLEPKHGPAPHRPAGKISHHSLEENPTNRRRTGRKCPCSLTRCIPAR